MRGAGAGWVVRVGGEGGGSGGSGFSSFAGVRGNVKAPCKVRNASIHTANNANTTIRGMHDKHKEKACTQTDTDIDTDTDTDRNTDRHKHKHKYKHRYMHTYLYISYIHTYTHIHTHTHTLHSLTSPNSPCSASVHGRREYQF